MVGRLLSFWEGPFSGATLVSGRVLCKDGPLPPCHLSIQVLRSALPKFPRFRTAILHLESMMKSLTQESGSFTESGGTLHISLGLKPLPKGTRYT